MYQIIKLRDFPSMKDAMADWFSSKWNVPRQAYEESMTACLAGSDPVPEWYVTLDGETIIGGLGVIENDFHNRPDLRPNVCAVYTEPAYRCQGVAGALLYTVCRDMAARGIRTLYLVTDHTSFYERYGWEYLCPVLSDGEEVPSRMYVSRWDGD